MNEYPINQRLTSAPAADFPPLDSAEEPLTLRNIIHFLFQNIGAILCITLAVFLSCLAYVLLTAPIYRADALLQLEQKEAPSMLMSAVAEMAISLPGIAVGNSPTEAEIEILRSRSILSKVVEDLKLDQVAIPKWFPVIGGAIARSYEGDGPAPPFLWLASYAWGGETIHMENLQVPDNLLDEELTLIAAAKGKYKVLDPDDALLLEGQVGMPAEGRGVRIFLSRLDARPGTRFIIMKQPRLEAIAFLQDNVNIQEKGRKSGIISLRLEGPDIQEVVAAINAIADRYLRQSVERRSEDSQRLLDSLNTEIPRIRAEADNADTALGEYRSQTGTLGMTVEAKALMEASTEVEKQLALLRIQKVEMEQKYTGNHPMLTAVHKKLAQMELERKKITQRIMARPETEIEAIGLERNAKVANAIYSQVLNKAQELAIAKASDIGNVQIVDRAERPDKAAKPKKLLIVALSPLFGFFLGIAFVLTRQALSGGVKSHTEIERRLGLPIYAMVFRCRVQPLRSKKQRQPDAQPVRFVLAEAAPDDPAMQSIRNVHTSLQYTMKHTANNIISITGPGPGAGSSFICANLGATLGESGKRILLVDADMRKGRLHETFGMRRSKGMSNLLKGETPLDDIIVPHVLKGLDFIPCGTAFPNPTGLLMNEGFQTILEELSSRYDIVLIDVPPVLETADAGIISRSAGICFLVVAYARQGIRQIELSYDRLTQNGVRVTGLVFNNIPSGRSGYGDIYD